MNKTYILDTSAIVSDPYCFKKFSNSQIIIHIDVLSELDKLKTYPDEAGRNARIFIRLLDSLTKKGNMNKGILLKNGSTLKTAMNYKEEAAAFGDPDYVDNKLLACALDLQNKKHNAVLVSKDINLRIRAQIFSIEAQDYNKHNVDISELHSGLVVINDANLGSKLSKEETIHCSSHPKLEKMLPNECVNFEDESGNGIALGRKTPSDIKLIKTKKLWNLNSRNREQAIAADLLMDPEIPLVTLIGKAGTGKSILTVAAGLELVINQKTYNKMVIYRPMEPIGKELGYLPGNIDEKLDPWTSAIKDCFEFLSGNRRRDNWKDMFAQYSDQIQFEAIAYIRGRSITNALIIVDEAQNITKSQIKTILTRVGAGSKIVLIGDVEQIDNRYLTTIDNGLTYTVEAFKDSDLSGHTTLIKGERSLLATEAAHRL